MRSFALIPALLVMLTFSCSAQKKIVAKDASQHIGQTVMVCDKVYNTEVQAASNTTLLYLGSETGAYLTVVVKGPENPKFKWHPETDFKGRTVCITGKVADYKGKPAVYVTDNSQIKLDVH
ncbi:hypothetical protein [Mucilaginibacter xinganensis]|uniref:DNA-binding protein n=1 Tax=Mucilaginibacter xinganensis TaxID=1234841 RepID=A0A223NRI9_9SPHI|nr:hypothetical protein [Mucilaginibacter xinganensis]ASU32370.1 hypothetical protein MuYL_0467 [Mucilaginibacter xinganensis]